MLNGKICHWLLVGFLAIVTSGCTNWGTPGNTDSPPVNPPDAADPTNPTDWASLYEKDRILDVNVDISEDDWNQLRFERRSMTEIFGSHCEEGLGESPYHYYPSTVTVDGTPLSNVGIRTKGLLGSINPSRPSLKVKLQEYDQDITFEDEKRFTFNNQNQDDSRLRTCLSYYLFEAAGVPASRCNFAHIKLNGSDFGIYANVEPIKKPMLKRVFGDDSGNLYEGTASDIRAGGFMVRVDKKTTEEENDWSDIHQLRDAIEAPDATFRDDIEAILNLESFITFWAAESLLGHWDGFSGNKNNYYTYLNPADGKFHFIPWGTDATFRTVRGGFSSTEQGDPISVMGAAKLTRRLWNEPDIRTRYQERMTELLEDIWKESELLAEVDRIKALIEPTVLPAHRESFATDIGEVRYYINTRQADFEREFEAGIPAFVSELDAVFGCMSKVGEVLVEMDTTYGTAGAENPFSTGSGTMGGSVFGFDLEVPAMGATAGVGEDSDDGVLVSLTAVGYISSEEFLIAVVNLPHWLIQPNTTVAINGQEVTGWFLRYRPGQGIQLLGFVGGSEVEFREAGTNHGDAISATIHLDIWGGGGGSGDEEDRPEDESEPED